MPYPPADGGAQAIHFTTLGLLANQIKIKILAINPSRCFVDLSVLPESYINSTNFESVNINTEIKFFKILINLFRTESYFIERFITPILENKISQVLIKERFDIIQLEHLYLCKYINTIRKHSNAKIILRPQNIEYVIWVRYAKNIKNPIKKIILNIAINRLRKFEQSVTTNLDGILALTKEDADIFSSFTSKKNISVIPMGYDYEKIKSYNFEKQFYGIPYVYHLGSMDWLPNEEAIKWFFKNIFPLINQTHKEIQIIIAGRKMPKWVYHFNSMNVKIIDAINNPISFQEDKPIMIVPLLSGSGIRAKIIEGLALGKTIISTTIGAQGIEYENNKNILIADTPTEFANQIIKCVNSPMLCREISENAKELSKKNYHYLNTGKKFIKVYNQLLENE